MKYLLLLCFLYNHCSIYSQVSGIAINIGYGKYFYSGNSFNDYRIVNSIDTNCIYKLYRDPYKKWITPEIEFSYFFDISDILKLNLGLKFNSKGKDITTYRNLSCADKYPLIQIKATYLHFPIYFETSPSSIFAVKIGFIGGIPISIKEIHNDSKIISPKNKIYNQLFKISKELSGEIRIKLNRFVCLNGGLFYGIDELNDNNSNTRIKYSGFRFSFQYNLYSKIR